MNKGRLNVVRSGRCGFGEMYWWRLAALAAWKWVFPCQHTGAEA